MKLKYKIDGFCGTTRGTRSGQQMHAVFNTEEHVRLSDPGPYTGPAESESHVLPFAGETDCHGLVPFKHLFPGADEPHQYLPVTSGDAELICVMNGLVNALDSLDEMTALVVPISAWAALNPPIAFTRSDIDTVAVVGGDTEVVATKSIGIGLAGQSDLANPEHCTAPYTRSSTVPPANAPETACGPWYMIISGKDVVGDADGTVVGNRVGNLVGAIVGMRVGWSVGTSVGRRVGSNVGTVVGPKVVGACDATGPHPIPTHTTAFDAAHPPVSMCINLGTPPLPVAALKSHPESYCHWLQLWPTLPTQYRPLAIWAAANVASRGAPDTKCDQLVATPKSVGPVTGSFAATPYTAGKSASATS